MVNCTVEEGVAAIKIIEKRFSIDVCYPYTVHVAATVFTVGVVLSNDITLLLRTKIVVESGMKNYFSAILKQPCCIFLH